MTSYPNPDSENTGVLILFDFREPDAAGELERAYAAHEGRLDYWDFGADAVMVFIPDKAVVS